MYIDTHCHVFSEYYDDIEEIVRKCKENNVTKIIVSGCDMKSNMEVLELANKYDIPKHLTLFDIKYCQVTTTFLSYPYVQYS